MATTREAFYRILSFFHKQQLDSDLDAELQSHLDLAIDENISHGMSPEEARRRALIRFGGVQQAKEQRTQEIGIRMALGATQGTVQLGIIGQTLRMAVLGIVVGAIASLAVSSLIASLLFGTTPTDPITFLAMVLGLGAIALPAGYIPARRASRIN